MRDFPHGPPPWWNRPKRHLRAAWVWAESLTWKRVQFALAKLVLLGVCILFIYLLMGIGFARISAKTNDQMRRVMEMQNERLTTLEENDQLRTSAVLNATATVSLVNLTAQQNAILTGYAERYHGSAELVNGSDLPPLYGGR